MVSAPGLAAAVGAAGLVVFLAAAAGGPGDPRSDAYRWLFVALSIVSALLCLAQRAAADAPLGERVS
jgi:hypothetical protein